MVRELILNLKQGFSAAFYNQENRVRLGMAIARQGIEQMGWRISFQHPLKERFFRSIFRRTVRYSRCDLFITHRHHNFVRKNKSRQAL